MPSAGTTFVSTSASVEPAPSSGVASLARLLPFRVNSGFVRLPYAAADEVARLTER